MQAKLAARLGLTHEQLSASLATYGYVTFWIGCSAGVILYNKWILTVWEFHFPITLTMWHMAFCSAVSFGLVPSPPRPALTPAPGRAPSRWPTARAAEAGTGWWRRGAERRNRT